MIPENITKELEGKPVKLANGLIVGYAKNVRIEGDKVMSSIEWDGKDFDMEFKVKEQENNETK